ncbi:mucosa-associated lymphoid tissue lymphoma translocation protein 1 homolog [Sinocyclocheilus grahami]|uniref:mucosa-associated lymphoid tissue lymphoma translocation protein 1 homolog n=1 Tax=Sinocyclocheilus grahami TaxID=75366 RepID=UPI0007ACC562|nr:PREDICTED: mucosa-associated lymphoid tissue lymphoma translocation protein 1 homolog [Sinocyclocheilus grahami]
MRTEVVILQQPMSVCVPPNHEVTLRVQAIGTGALKYQWFDKQQAEVAGGTEPELTVSLQRSGKYTCRVSDLYCNYQFTEWVKVRILDEAGVSHTWRGEPHIVIHPISQTVKPGETFTLKCTVATKTAKACDLILWLLCSDLGKDPLVRGRQVVEIRHTLTEPRALTDPVRTSGHTMELHRRDACWKQANVLPCRRSLDFQYCGVKVELSFSALFSNVLVVFATVRNSSAMAQDCTLILESEPQMQDIFSGSGRSEEMDSLLVNSGETPDCTLRLCCLQRLQGSLVIKVTLHYTHTQTKERLTESKELDIGRPLIASCKLNQMRPVDRRQESRVHTVDHMSNIRYPHHQNHPRPGQPYTRKAENRLQSSAKSTSTSSNEPEENDEND